MGTDDLHHKRRRAKIAETRKISTKVGFEYILIVCEGSKTEPHYFNELITHYRLPSVNVKISGDCGSDPMSVVDHGITLYKNEKKFNGRVFDKVFFVFDRDQYHLDGQRRKYQSALSKIKDQAPKKTFIAINSVPCFEYWLLLHHGPTTKPYNGMEGCSSSGDAVLSDLKKYWPEYCKGSRDIFKMALQISNDDLDTAKKNAQQSLISSESTQDENPSTKVHELVQYLQDMLKSKNIN